MSDNQMTSTAIQESQTPSKSKEKKHRRVRREDNYRPTPYVNKSIGSRTSPRPTRSRQKPSYTSEYVSGSSSGDSDDEDSGIEKTPKKLMKRSARKSSGKDDGGPTTSKKRKRNSSPETPITDNDSPCSSSSSVKMSNLVMISQDPKVYWHKKGESAEAEKKRQQEVRERMARNTQNCGVKFEKLVDKVMPFMAPSCKNKAELSAERYSNLHSVFLILFKIHDGRTDLRPDIANSVRANTPGVTFYHCCRVKSYFDGEKRMWQLGHETPMDSTILKEIKTHSCPGVRSVLKIDGTMLELWQSLLLRCPRCTTASSLSRALWKVKAFIENEVYRRDWAKIAEERKLKEERQKKAEERIQREREEEAVVDGQMFLATLLLDYDSIVDTNKEWYNNLNAFFLNQFKLPERRTVLRPDIGNPVVTNAPDWAFKHMVRAHTSFRGQKEIWQLGDETPMDSSLLKEIVTHKCHKSRSLLYTRGTMLDLWHSLLLHCPDCTVMSSLSKALNKVTRFIEAECSRPF